MQKNCYWFLKEDDQETRMKAICEDCHNKVAKIGIFWEGSFLGYGDYDLYCDVCESPIHLRDKNGEIKTSS